MTHIYLFTENSQGGLYGIGTYIKQLISILKNIQDISLNIVELNADCDIFITENKAEYRKFIFPKTKPSKVSLYYRNVWYVLQQFIRMNVDEPLIFHLNFQQHAAFAKYFRKKHPKCQIYLTVHYFRWAFLIKGNLEYLRKIINTEPTNISNDAEYEVYKSVEEDKKLFLLMDKIICLTNYSKTILSDDYKIPIRKIEMISNGIMDVYKPISPKEKQELRKKLSLSSNDLLLLFVGRLEELKGVDILINAFKKLLITYPNAKLVIIGEGDYSKYFKEIKNYWTKIILTGYLGKDDVYTFYQMADVGVLLSYNEQCSYVAIEMMMQGLPMVICDHSGLSDMLDQENEQFKIPVISNTISDEVSISVDNINGKIIAAYNDKEYSKRVRNNYLNKYHFDQMKYKYLKNYHLHEREG